MCACEYKYIQIHMYVSTGGAKVPAASKYGFHLHAESYVGSSGSSDTIRFDTVVGGLNTIPEFLYLRLWYKNLNFRLGGHWAAPSETTWPPPVAYVASVAVNKSVHPSVAPVAPIMCCICSCKQVGSSIC